MIFETLGLEIKIWKKSLYRIGRIKFLLKVFQQRYVQNWALLCGLDMFAISTNWTKFWCQIIGSKLIFFSFSLKILALINRNMLEPSYSQGRDHSKATFWTGLAQNEIAKLAVNFCLNVIGRIFNYFQDSIFKRSGKNDLVNKICHSNSKTDTDLLQK